MPSTGILPHFKFVIGDTLDFGVKVMTFEVQFLAADLPLNLSVADASNLTVLADEPLNIKKRQQLTQPGMEQMLGIVPGCGDIDSFVALNRCGIGDQRVKRLAG